KDYRLSISGFNRYLDCPLSFFYETVLRVPTRAREQATFGNALHQALQDYYLRMLGDSNRVFPSRAELLYYFEQAIQRLRPYFTAKSYPDWLDRGRRELAAYYDKYRSSWTNQAKVEQRISNSEIGGVPLTGVIDRIDFLSDATVAIWDYKSGAHAKDRLRKPSNGHPHGGSYWRQLIFYKLLYENRPGPIRRVVESGISFLVMDTKGEQPIVKVDIEQEDLSFLTQLIAETWTNIQAQKFSGCGKADCKWCNFVREEVREVPNTSVEVELLDD
ncbi:MAG: PD-(D/E)XK nuclease family protein, partial [Bacteroidota bacterium]